MIRISNTYNKHWANWGSSITAIYGGEMSKDLMHYRIEDGVPIERKVGRKPKYPWKQLAVGQSFLAKNVNPKSFCSQAYLAALRLGVKFKCRTMGNDVRVWRME